MLMQGPQVLPLGLKASRDEASGREYYYNKTLGLTQYEHPASLKPAHTSPPLPPPHSFHPSSAASNSGASSSGAGSSRQLGMEAAWEAEQRANRMAFIEGSLPYTTDPDKLAALQGELNALRRQQFHAKNIF